jgi:hypothetical protein
MEAQMNWQAFMTATLVPPAQRIRHVDAQPVTRSVDRSMLVEVATVECECPEFCPIDHEND